MLEGELIGFVNYWDLEREMTKKVKDAELEIEDKISLSIDDFEDVDFWKTLLKRLDVPNDSEEIFFKAQDVTYSN